MKRKDSFESRYRWIYKRGKTCKITGKAGRWKRFERALINPIFNGGEMMNNGRNLTFKSTVNDCKGEKLCRTISVPHLHTKTNR